MTSYFVPPETEIDKRARLDSLFAKLIVLEKDFLLEKKKLLEDIVPLLEEVGVPKAEERKSRAGKKRAAPKKEFSKDDRHRLEKYVANHPNFDDIKEEFSEFKINELLSLCKTLKATGEANIFNLPSHAKTPMKKQKN